MPDEQLPAPTTAPASYAPPSVEGDRLRTQRLLEEQAAELEASNEELQQALVALADRTRAAEAGEQRAREILESITDGFYALDDEGRFTYVNAALERIAGLPREAMLGRVAFELFGLGPDSLPRRKYEEARLTGQGQAYESYVARIGRLLEFRSYPGPASYSVFIRDVTEERRVLEALRLSEERWRLAGEAAVDLMYDWNLRTGALFFTDSLRSRFLHPRYEPRIEWWEAQLHPDDRAAVEADLRRAIDGDDASWECEYRFRRGDGSWATVAERGHFVRDADGHATRMVGAMRDVTERRRAEERIARAEKMDVMGQLAASVAHDFNNLLTAMFGYLELADGELAEGTAEAARADLAEVRRAAEQAAALTRQLLVFSRQQHEQPRAVQLGEVVRVARGLLERLLGREHALRIEVADGAWPVRIDATHAEQALMNLVVNARDAMPAGGPVRVTVDNVVLDAPLDAAPAALAPGEWVRLAVRDAGTGMDAATMARMWEPFFTTKPAGLGTGLGLPTVLGLVERAGGGVVVTSAPGQGTTFALYLPRVRAAVEPAAPAEPPPRGAERVAFVEEEPAVLEALRRALVRHGYDVHAASSPDEAGRLVRAAGGVDVIVIDVSRAVEPAPVVASLGDASASAPVLLLAGVHRDGAIRDGALSALEGRRVVVLEKPFTTDALLRALRRTIDG